jgi:hypothetical protein
MTDFRQVARMMTPETLMHFAEHGKSWERPVCKSVIRERLNEGHHDLFDAIECERLRVI